MQQHLIERLDLIKSAQTVLRERHLLIVATAGYGKSVLLDQLLRFQPDAVYLRLTVDDNDVEVLRQRVENSEAQVLLLDDVHLISAESESATWLESQLAATTRKLLLAGRYLPFDATLPLVQGQAVQWTEDELRFSEAATSQLLSQDVTAVHQLDGWPIAIGLLRHLPEEQRTSAIAREHLFSYLTKATFDQLPGDLRHFLQVCAVPEMFSAELAAHLLNSDREIAADQITETIQRNLFIYPAGTTGWYRFHDLIRDFLRSMMPAAEHVTAANSTLMWLREHDTISAAIEFALSESLFPEAADLINGNSYLFERDGRAITYRRWIKSLPSHLFMQSPQLILFYARVIVYLPSYIEELDTLLQHASDIARMQGDSRSHLAATTFLASLNTKRGLHHLAIPHYVELLQSDLKMPVKDRERTRSNLIISLANVGQFAQAEDEVRALDSDLYSRLALMPQEEQQAARETIWSKFQLMYITDLYITYQRHGRVKPLLQEAAENLSTLFDRSRLLEKKSHWLCLLGRWQQATEALQQCREYYSQATVDGSDYDLALWIMVREITIATALGDFAFAKNNIELLLPAKQSYPVANYVLGILELRLQHARRDFETALPHAEQLLDIDLPLTVFRSEIALLRDVSAGMLFADGKVNTFTMHVETVNVIRFRKWIDMLQLRMLLMIVCHKRGCMRWRRHANSALRTAQRREEEQVLVAISPVLSSRFWLVLFTERLHVDQAKAALITLNQYEPVVALLTHADADVRADAADVLVAIGDERAMDGLNVAISAEKHPPTKQRLITARDTLETSPPPTLYLKMMGPFQVMRGNDEIHDFHRPAVVRLLQYFATRRGVAIPRDQILEALWPDANPEKALVTFRTTYSRLRNALEPHMRSKGPNRYFSPGGETYTFDPDNFVIIDREQFELCVSNALNAGGVLSDDLLTQLSTYSQLLPDLPYADWLLEHRERLQELYVNGCLHVGQVLLAQGNSAEAQQWAQRVLSTAPWMEAAYQLLMRAYSRQNMRTRALRSYQEAHDALQNELAVEPAPLTQWLFKRLQAGEII